jgi:hypothetical protein
MKTYFLNVKRFVRPMMMIEYTPQDERRSEDFRRECTKNRAGLGLNSGQSETTESAYTTTHNSLPERGLDVWEDLHQTECYCHDDASGTE